MPEALDFAGLLALGLALGMRHALEADHVAAVAALATRSRSVGHTVWQGVAWGAGHTLTLFVFGGVALAMHAVVPERLAVGLECAVAVMLIGLGADVLRRLRRDRVHFHVHSHDDGVVHVHAHAHTGEAAPHDARRHRHAHLRSLPLRALLVGMMHGMAGTAALILIMLGRSETFVVGLAQIAAFGVGSIFGMAVLSIAIAVPLRASARFFDRAHRALRALTGCATLALGAVMLVRLVAA